MKILLLTRNEMTQVLSMEGAIEAVKEALAVYSSGARNIPLRVNLDIPAYGGQSLYMPGYAPSPHALGVKIVSVFPGNADKGIASVPAAMVLLDDTTGQVVSLMDGTCLTQLRTGAAAGAATDLLARRDAEKFVLIGTGGQAAAQLEAVLTVRAIKQVRVMGRNTNKARVFAQAMARRFHVDVSVSTDLDEDVRTADVITAVTTALDPVFQAAQLKPGVHINGVGSYTPKMSEIPLEVLQVADKIYVDTRDAVIESGDFQKPIAAGLFDVSNITGELGDLINGKTAGRVNAGEITFFETTGNAILDIVVAKKIYDAALALGIGTSVDL